jgi:non-ribosomal peptide synthetase-like protein
VEENFDEKAAAALSLLFSAPLPSSLWGIGTLQSVWAFLQKAMEVVFLVPFLYLIRTVPVLSMTEEGQGGGGEEGRGHVFLSLGTSLLHLIWLWTIMQLAMFFVGSGLVAVLKRLLLLLGGGGEEKDSYPLASFAFFRRWAVDNLMGSLTVFTKQLRGTVYLPLWYRLMGAKVGRHAEMSAFENVCAERLTLKDYVFVADDVIVGLPHVEKGMVTHGSVSIGRRSFVGNNSVVQARTSIADNVLVGVLSLAPKMNNVTTTAAAATDAAEEGETFLGSPPFKIQRRAVTGAGGPNNACAAATTTTYDPPAGMLLLRYLVEGLGFVLLQLSLATCFALLYVSMSWFYTSIVGNGGGKSGGLVCYLLSLPFFIMGAAGVAALLTLFWKWTVIGRFKAGSYPLYGTYVWRTEFVERIEENLLQSFTYPLVTGTVWMQWVCQAMGVRMGRRAYLDNPYFCEPDLCTVGDYLNMERMASLQAHLFQDRVRTTGPVKVGDFCSLGSDSVVLVGGVMGDHCSLSSLSLVLRSEELPSHTQWHGLPAVRLFQHHDARGAGGFGGGEVEMGLLEEGGQRGK